MNLPGLLPVRGWRAAVVTVATQFLAAFIVDSLPRSVLAGIYPLMRTRKWEDEGKFYERVFHIRAWKDYIPALGVFDKKHMSSHPDSGYVSTYLLEGLRAELCHALALLFGAVIIVFSAETAKTKIFLWEIVLNIPCIMIQRFNRPRFERLRKKAEETGQ